MRICMGASTIPFYCIGSGGTDKNGSDEKRIVGDQTAPHPESQVRERNKPHGEPDGPLLVSMNNMMGPPPGSTPKGQRLDETKWPMPDPESKPRPRHAYHDAAVLSHMAHVNDTFVAGFGDDGSSMFFQFEHSPEEERTCSFIVVVPLPRLDHRGEAMHGYSQVLITRLPPSRVARRRARRSPRRSTPSATTRPTRSSPST